ncbi:MAG: flagellar hook capping FlgD N-terminal domain-containing protein [Planctomycetota bacterium]
MSAISSVTGDNPLISRTSDVQSSVPATPQVQTSDSNPFAEVSSEEWLNIILEELSNQDPFEPNDTSATLEQLNSLRSIESDLELQDQLQALVLQNSIGQAGALIGLEVEGLSNTGLNTTGIVNSVRVVDGESVLQLESGSTIDFANVTNIANSPAAASSEAADDALASLVSDPATDDENPEDQEVEVAL